MSFITSQHHQAFENFWVTNSGVVQTGVEAINLAPQAIGFYDVSPTCAEINLAVTTPNIKKTKRMKIKMGQLQSGADVRVTRILETPLETVGFTADDIVSFSGVKSYGSDTSKWKQHRIALGYDGFDAKKSINAQLDSKPLLFSFVLQGDPVQKYFGQNQVIYEFPLDKGLCAGDCDCVDACGKMDCKAILTELKRAMAVPVPKMAGNGQIVNYPITDFVDIKSITKCAASVTPVAPVLVEYSKYSISICDDGATNLSKLAEAYPGVKVFLDSRKEGISTYSFWQLSATAAPADFTLTTHVQPICDTCPTCPDTYTKVPAQKTVQVRVECGAVAPVIAGATSTVKVSGSLEEGDAYLITLPAATTDATIEAALTGCVEFEILGEIAAQCVGGSATFTWKACEECNKASKDYMIVLSDKDCPAGDHLAELQAAYPELVVAVDQTGSCVHSYKTSVMSSCIAAPVSTCITAVETEYSFEAPINFKGKPWEEATTILITPDCTTPVVAATDCCSCGIIVEGKAFMRDSLLPCDPAILPYNPNEVLGVKVHATVYSYDYTSNHCDVSKEYVTVLQEEKFPQGTPGSLVINYEKARLAYEDKFYIGNIHLDSANRFNLVTKVDEWYDHYRIVLKNKMGHSDNRLMSGVDDIAYNIFFKEGTGKSFEAKMNALILSTGREDLSAVVL